MVIKEGLLVSLSKTAVLMGFAGVLLMSLVLDATSAERERGACRRGDRLRIQDLDMSPDPIIEGLSVRLWKVRIRLDGNRDCDTEIGIREGGEFVGRERRYTLHPGINEIDIEPVEGFRFRAKEHCVRVVVDLEGTRREIDADRRFCARQRPAWSMREPGDPRGPAR